ncbi:MAG: hypothetical protein A2806_01185 [Candidatus Terrybacteria bacterium RIFCSPHIGHO2_01_FULL_48_17]|uniref:Membrane insertase YidC/Oxa/ALB C-terminal domain-containing protein n=1 Tax=Candidatus Terrybacteria bacterium RIFCSPHIGHO2_01_FULL_48_17 TaxID=1802362 RepID=A0A1G2PM79_9BACT|nr:MAG: hypothetical protein A2806_01185 [Candidatus Terrybacteria bacterium RIFCSPHIGHO2_01_FULL_48_17]OHA53416.1 MAG: hypothetical protein A3A30_02765 [Candidatus Terrybacteria bacterium RIFCSPLOWO2_01_FULL_48_14]
MNVIGNAFHVFVSQPLENLLAGVYAVLPWQDLGLAIIIFTIIVRLALFPLTVKALAGQRALTKLQPKIQELQKRFKHDREAQGREIMSLYREHNINPFVSLMPVLAQLPILFALWRILLRDVHAGAFENLYGFIPDPGNVSLLAFGFLDLSVPSPYLAVAAGLAQLVQSRMSIKDTGQGGGDFAKMLSKQTLFVFPAITVVIAWKFPAALALYWFVTTVISAAQYRIAQKMVDNKDNHGTTS